MRGLRDLDAVVVSGASMAPALRPGDRLFVEAWTYRRRPPQRGEVVLAADPRRADRELVKRVSALEGDTVILAGDAAASTDSRTFGPIPVREVRWRAAFRYWPLRRAGWIRVEEPVSG